MEVSLIVVLVDIEKEYIYADEFCTVVVKNSQTGMYTGLADFIVCNFAVEEYKESLKERSVSGKYRNIF